MMTPITPGIASIFAIMRWHSLEVDWWRPREGMVGFSFKNQQSSFINRKSVLGEARFGYSV